MFLFCPRQEQIVYHTMLYTTLPNGKIINYNNNLYYGTNRTQLALNSQITNLQSQITNIENNPNIYVRSGTTSQTYNWKSNISGVYDTSINNIPINFALLSIRITSGTVTMNVSSTRTGNIDIDINAGQDNGILIGSAGVSMSSSHSEDEVTPYSMAQCVMTSNNKEFYIITNPEYITPEQLFSNSKFPISITYSDASDIPSGTSFSVSLNFSYKGIYFTFWQNFKFSIFATYF